MEETLEQVQFDTWLESVGTISSHHDRIKAIVRLLNAIDLGTQTVDSFPQTWALHLRTRQSPLAQKFYTNVVAVAQDAIETACEKDDTSRVVCELMHLYMPFDHAYRTIVKTSPAFQYVPTGRETKQVRTAPLGSLQDAPQHVLKYVYKHYGSQSLMFALAAPVLCSAMDKIADNLLSNERETMSALQSMGFLTADELMKNGPGAGANTTSKVISLSYGGVTIRDSDDTDDDISDMGFH